MSYVNQVIILRCGPSLLHYYTLPNKAFLQFGQGKKRIYLETQLKGEFTYLF